MAEAEEEVAAPFAVAEPVLSLPTLAATPICSFICYFCLSLLAICVDVEVVLVRMEPSE